MKYLKMLGLAAAFAAALTAFTGSATATQLTSPKGTVYTGTVTGTSSRVEMHGPFTTILCMHSELDGSVESHGSAVTATVKLASILFSGCGNAALTPIKPGTLEIHTDSASADGNGTVTWNGLELRLHTSVGECVYTTSATKVGTLTGSDTGSAVWNFNSALLPRTGGTFFCGSTGTITGGYTFTTPSTLTVD